MINLKTPISDEDIGKLKLGDKISISGIIYTGRDAILPKLVNKLENNEMINADLEGSVIMHTAVGDAGISPTTSNKVEIESSIIPLSKNGVKVHIGKGSLNSESISGLKEENSIIVVTPPTAALLTNTIQDKKVLMFEEEGIEALFKLKVENLPGIVAVINGESLF